MNLSQLVRVHWDRFGAGALFAVGGLVLILGWVGVSQEALTALQIPYVISGGLGGLFLLGLGGVMWLSADLRDEWRKLDAIEAALETRSEAPASPPTPSDEWDDTAAVEGVPARTSNGSQRARTRKTATTRKPRTRK